MTKTEEASYIVSALQREGLIELREGARLKPLLERLQPALDDSLAPFARAELLVKVLEDAEQVDEIFGSNYDISRYIAAASSRAAVGDALLSAIAEAEVAVGERDAASVRIERAPLWGEAELVAAESQLGWPLPEEYRTLLARCGPFIVREVDDIAELKFLTPEAGAAERAPLKAFLEQLAALDAESGVDAPEMSVMNVDGEALLVVRSAHSEDGHFSWAFYCRGSDVLHRVHRKHGHEGSERPWALERDLAESLSAIL